MSGYRGIKVGSSYHYGQHMMLTGYACGEVLQDIGYMQEFLVDLVQAIDMVQFGPPMVYRFGQGAEIGLSGAVFIETSLISFHTNDAARDIYLDVFSCKTFDPAAVQEFVATRLSPVEHKFSLVWRD